jgi:hypothetical protein
MDVLSDLRYCASESRSDTTSAATSSTGTSGTTPAPSLSSTATTSSSTATASNVPPQPASKSTESPAADNTARFKDGLQNLKLDPTRTDENVFKYLLRGCMYHHHVLQQ